MRNANAHPDPALHSDLSALSEKLGSDAVSCCTGGRDDCREAAGVHGEASASRAEERGDDLGVETAPVKEAEVLSVDAQQKLMLEEQVVKSKSDVMAAQFSGKLEAAVRAEGPGLVKIGGAAKAEPRPTLHPWFQYRPGY